MSRRLLALPLLALAAGCPADDQESWVRFNADDTIEVAIAPGEPGDPVSADLHSTSGATAVGTVTVDPGSGPVGTDHEVWVNVNDAFEEVVGKVTLSVDSGARGIEEFSLNQDSADHGAWWVELRSVGEEGDTRTDVFSVLLFSEEEADVELDDSGAAR